MDIRDRSFDFSAQTVHFCQTLTATSGALPQLAASLLQAACALGLQVEEAHGSAKTDFIAQMQAAAKSARATHYWLRLIEQTKLANPLLLEPLQDEAQQLAAILSSIVKTAKRNES